MEQDLATESTAEAAETQKSTEPTAPDGVEPRETTDAAAHEAGTTEPAVATESSEQQQEPPAPPANKPATVTRPALPPPIEAWANNERMRHIPSAGWIAEKVEHDLRQRLEILVTALEAIPSADPRHEAVEQALRSVCGALDQLAHAARHSRAATPPNELANRVGWSINNAASSVRAIDANNFGRRYPFHTFERSKAESVYAALLVVIDRLDRALPLVRELDPAIDERLLQGLVNLQSPMRQEKIA